MSDLVIDAIYNLKKAIEVEYGIDNGLLEISLSPELFDSFTMKQFQDEEPHRRLSELFGIRIKAKDPDSL